MAASLLVFFVVSGQWLRGFLALVPVSAALLISFPDLNEIYLAFSNGGDLAATLDRVVPVVWLASGAAGMCDLFWGAVDRWWRPQVGLVRSPPPPC